MRASVDLVAGAERREWGSRDDSPGEVVAGRGSFFWIFGGYGGGEKGGGLDVDEMVVFGVVGCGNRVGGVDGECLGRGVKDEEASGWEMSWTIFGSLDRIQGEFITYQQGSGLDIRT